MEAELDTTGWTEAIEAGKEAIEEGIAFRLYFEGTHSVLNQSNERIAEHALDNGDELWTFSDGTLNECARIVAASVAAIMNGDESDLEAAMDEAGQLARADIYSQVITGQIPGPSRTSEWNQYKGERWGGLTPNLVASGEWLDSLQYEVVYE